MKDVIIVGAGGHGAELDDYIKSHQKTKGVKAFNLVGFLDDDPLNGARYKLSAPLIGSISDHKVIKSCFYIIGIANLKYRRPLVEKFINEGARFTTLIHGNAYVSESAIIGEGSVIGPHANIGPNAKIGNFTLINSRCSIGHDSIIGDYNAISPNVCFSGFTKIGNENLFGINSATIPGIIVGDKNIIAAGMILDQGVGNDSIVFYRYKERVIAVPKAPRVTKEPELVNKEPELVTNEPELVAKEPELVASEHELVNNEPDFVQEEYGFVTIALANKLAQKTLSNGANALL